MTSEVTLQRHEPYECGIRISMEKVLFGAIALNLIILMCIVIAIGGIVVIGVDTALIGHYLRGITLFALNIGAIAIVSQVAQFFSWGARGFIETRPFPIAIIAVFFTLYGISGIYSGLIDGYVALAVVAFTALVVAVNHWRQFLSRLTGWLK